MKEFWNERYDSEEYVYGEEPNEFLARILPNLKKGKILFPCEGEGRNSVFAARHGWSAVGVDWSESGKKKALSLAEKYKANIEYIIGDVSHLDFQVESFDAIALVFAHFPKQIREGIHKGLMKFLKPGGYILLEGFSKDHVKFQAENPNVGGPKDPSMLFSTEMILSEFSGLQIEICE
ncbi:MAG: class I SAM-dependent methyltransferase, partial [Leptospira sp.]|nr:class I SAM-dependent methyltransferase [Leptospira sp.]